MYQSAEYYQKQHKKWFKSHDLFKKVKVLKRIVVVVIVVFYCSVSTIMFKNDKTQG